MNPSLYLLFGRARASVLRVMHEATEQGTPLHLREIGRRAGVSATAVQYELRLLRQLGMVQDIGTEKRPLYVLNRQHELFPDLHNMILRRSDQSLLSADDAHLARKRVQQRRDRGARSEQNSAFLKQWGTLADKVRVR